MEGGREEVRDARRRGLPPVPPPRRRPAALLLLRRRRRRRRRDDAGSGDGDGAHVRAGEQARAWARGAALRRRLRPRAGARHARPPHLLLHLRDLPPSQPGVERARDHGERTQTQQHVEEIFMQLCYKLATLNNQLYIQLMEVYLLIMS